VEQLIVEKQILELGLDKNQVIVLDSGKSFGPISIAYEIIGTLNEKKDNAILICHALSGDSHVAGKYALEDKKPGWWDVMVGPGKPFDTDTYCIICSNTLGGCRGTTGPASINPVTEKPYALDFPVITINDMVKVQKLLIDHLGIQQLYCVAGGSMGGMQALAWIINFPSMVRSAAIIASAAYTSSLGIAFDKVGRNAIMSDPNFGSGDYYGRTLPRHGLAIARMIGHITYLSDESMRKKFSRSLQDKDELSFELSDDFAVESYLEYQGGSFVQRFDANSYLYVTKAMDYFDLPGKYGSLEKALKDVTARMLVVSFTSDWLFPTYQSVEIVKALMKNRKDVSFCEIQSSAGHDAFLLEFEKLGRILQSFLGNGRTGS